MPSYDYSIALDALSDVDKNRLLCVLLSSEWTTINANVNWDKATSEFGAASCESMRVMVRTALKKIETAGGKINSDGKSSAASSAPTTPMKKGRAGKSSNKSSPKKRKVSSLLYESEDMGDDDLAGDDDVKVEKKEEIDDDDDFEAVLASK